MDKNIVYVSPTKECYSIDDIYVTQFKPVFTVQDERGESISTTHDAFAVYQKSTNRPLDTFNGFGYGTKEEAEKSIEGRMVAILSTDEPIVTDHFNYQSVEEVPTILEEDMDAMNRNLILMKLEYYRLCLFKENHADCGKGRNHGTIGAGYRIVFTYNAIGRSVTVECPFCGHSADITDYSAW